MCEFKPGDEVVCVNDRTATTNPIEIQVGKTYTVADVIRDVGRTGLTGRIEEGFSVVLAEVRCSSMSGGYDSRRFRKVERRNDSLTIEAFLTIKPGFEEPRRAPAKKRERVQ